MSVAVPVLGLQSISKAFGGKPAVKDVSFAVQKGDIVGFLGPNGAGKTTTLRIALGLLKPERGDVRLFGQIPGADTFGRVGFLPEERGLYRKMKARAAIAHIACLNGMATKPAFKRADELLDAYGLGDAGHKKIKTLSKGMAQKVQVIAAIAHNPELLVLDEPFSGLDPVNQKLLETMVKDAAHQGRTVIFSTHVMEHAERLCDKIVLMSGGSKIFDGDLDKALAHAPRYLNLSFEAPVDTTLLSPFAQDVQSPKLGAYHLRLKPQIRSIDVLEACLQHGQKPLHFEPVPANLHDAFVALVGTDKRGGQNE